MLMKETADRISPDQRRKRRNYLNENKSRPQNGRGRRLRRQQAVCH